MTDTVKQLYRPGVLHRIEPVHNPAPLVFDIPRSGRDYPNNFRSPAGFSEVKSSISMFGCPQLEQCHRAVVAHEANRRLIIPIRELHPPQPDGPQLELFMR